MARAAFQRDNVLTVDERATSARKCVSLLGDVHPHDMKAGDWTFFSEQLAQSKNIRYAPSEPQLQWLRDMVDRYVTKG
jgi:hypothetical protein